MASIPPSNVAANLTLNANAFAKCAPAIGTNLAQCGTVTQCNALPLTSTELSTTYMKSGDFRVMESLLMHDMEIKMCETVQNGLYEFLMANRVNLSKRISTTRLSSGLLAIAPFILARQYSPINNEYWTVQSGMDPGGTPDWRIVVASDTGIPADVRSFPTGMRIFVDGYFNGTALKSAWEVITATKVGNTVQLDLDDQNAASHLDPDKIYEDGVSSGPTVGLVRRGTPNVNDYERWCSEAPAYTNWKNVPFWVETTRTSMCKSSLYDKWRKLVMEGNALYREFFDLDEISKNRQLAQDWQKRWVNSVFFNKPLANQTMALYDNLTTIDAFDITTTWTGAELGVDGGKCVGKRANAVGIYEQLAECGRIFDLQGAKLNLGALFRIIYQIMRVRDSNGRPSSQIDLFTDTATAELFNRAMIKYYNSKSDGMLRLTMPVDGDTKTANFGFNYRSYRLFWPNVTINIVTHYFFDDYLSAAKAAGFEDMARVLWILDFAGIYPGILASNRKVQMTGDLKTLAAINPDFACVMEVPTQEQTLTSLTFTVIVECPASNLILENFSGEVPDEVDDSDIDYSGGETVTTTTTPGD